MKIVIGSDHRGVDLKAGLARQLNAAGHETHDVGVFDAERVDYPDVAELVGNEIAEETSERGILICSSGIGMSIAANKINAVRAAACYDERQAELSRRHNNANVLCLSASMVSEADNRKIVDRWLNTEFEGGRHGRRVDKIRGLEEC